MHFPSIQLSLSLSAAIAVNFEPQIKKATSEPTRRERVCAPHPPTHTELRCTCTRLSRGAAQLSLPRLLYRRCSSIVVARECLEFLDPAAVQQARRSLEDAHETFSEPLSLSSARGPFSIFAPSERNVQRCCQAYTHAVYRPRFANPTSIYTL